MVLEIIEYHKAFNTIEVEKIAAVLTKFGVDYMYIHLIYKIYKMQSRKRYYTRKLNLLTQGDPMSPKVISTILEYD